MAQFEQSSATRQAMTEAAQSYLFQYIQDRPAKALAATIGVTPRTVQRWKAFLSGSSAQSRAPNLAKVAAATTSIEVRLDAVIAVGDDPKYRRRRTGIQVQFSADEASALLAHALSDDEDEQDEAWQDFFDAYVMPAGTVEQARITLR